MIFQRTPWLLGAVFIASSVFSIACTDLEPEVFGGELNDQPVSSVLPAVPDPEAALISVYNGLGEFAEQEKVFALMEHSSDELIGPTRGTDWSDLGVWRQLHAHTWTSDHIQVRNAYRLLTNRYFGATQVIYAVENGGTGDQQLIAQAKFLRAFYMGFMVDLFGQVPFREATEGIGIIPRTLSRSEATDLVIQDLRDAIAVLPEFSSDGTGVRNGRGRISKQAAQTYLMRMLLNKGVFKAPNPAGPYNFEAADMNEIVSLANSVIGTSGLSLQAPGTYFQQFGPDNTAQGTEAIFALQYQQGDNFGNKVSNRYRMTLHYNQEVDGWNGFTTVADFLNKWDREDERFSADPLASDAGIRAGFLEGQQFAVNNGERVPLQTRKGAPLVFTPEVDLFYSAEAAGVRVIKYYPDYASAGDPNNDLVLLRLADVYLMKAEAQLRSGDNGSALATVNQLRASRRGAKALSSLNEETMLDERGFEMYWEGLRRSDQIRFGTYTRPYTEKEYESNPRVYLFPIPTDQLTANSNITQNPGY